MQLKFGFLAVALVVTISGCANNDAILKKQTETDARLEMLLQGNAAVNARLAELSRDVNDLQAQVKTNSTSIEELKPAVKKIRDAIDSISRQKSPETASNPVPRIEVVNREPTPVNKDTRIQNEYMKAFALFSANKYDGAVEAFSSFMKRYPESEYAGNAQYWIGECHYSQQDFPRAVTAFNRVISAYPKGGKVPDAMLKLGFSYISMNDQAKAKVALQNLIDKYPNSQAAIKAKERLSHF